MKNKITGLKIRNYLFVFRNVASYFFIETKSLILFISFFV